MHLHQNHMNLHLHQKHMHLHLHLPHHLPLPLLGVPGGGGDHDPGAGAGGRDAGGHRGPGHRRPRPPGPHPAAAVQTGAAQYCAWLQSRYILLSGSTAVQQLDFAFKSNSNEEIKIQRLKTTVRSNKGKEERICRRGEKKLKNLV